MDRYRRADSCCFPSSLSSTLRRPSVLLEELTLFLRKEAARTLGTCVLRSWTSWLIGAGLPDGGGHDPETRQHGIIVEIGSTVEEEEVEGLGVVREVESQESM